jgi:putative sterol carrier protein
MREREAFGRPIGKFQALRHRMADLMTEIEAARQLVYHAAWLYEQGDQAIRESSMAKLYATELNKRVADECLQFFGGYGYTEEYPISRFFRDARVSTIVAGTSEIMREIIAKTEIDEVRFPSIRDREPEVASPSPPPPGQSESVEPTVRALFESLPRRFRADRAAEWTATFHFTITGAEQEEWTVRIDDGRCEVSPGHDVSPSCTVSMKEDTYLSIESGETDPQMAVLMGKVKISNLAAMMKFAKCFDRVQPASSP